MRVEWNKLPSASLSPLASVHRGSREEKRNEKSRVAPLALEQRCGKVKLKEKQATVKHERV